MGKIDDIRELLKKIAEKKLTRREAIWIITTATINAVTTFVVTNGISGTTKVVKEAFNNSDIIETNFFKRYLDIDNIIQIYPGEGNILSAISGEGKISPYIKSACQNFSLFLHGENPKRKEYIKVSCEDPDLFLSDDNDILYLGGPVANILSGKDIGYVYEENKQGMPFPIFREKTSLRWGFDVGKEDYGERDGIAASSIRYEGGKPYKRALYALKDNKFSGKLRFPAINQDGLSQEDFLLITKLPNPRTDRERNILSIGGMHGHSIKRFASDLPSSFNRLKTSKEIGDDKFFQILIPCILEHKQDRSGQIITKARINWAYIEYEAL